MVNKVLDLVLHNSYVDGFWNGTFFIYYPGYQILVGAFRKITGLSVEWSSIIVLSLANVASVLISAQIIDELCTKKTTEVTSKCPNFFTYVVSAMVNIAQPIFTSTIRPGWSSGNSFISPTQAVCKPFALLSVLFFFRMYRKRKFTAKKQIAFFFFLAISCLMKPLFAMAFIPAMGIILLIDEIVLIRRGSESVGKACESFIKKIWPLFVSGLVLIAEFLATSFIPTDMAHHEQGGIGFGLWYAWGLVVPNIFISILMAYAFPITLFILILISKPKNIISSDISTFIKMVIPYAILAFALISFLFQKGSELSVDFRTAWCLLFTLIYSLAGSLLMNWKNTTKESTRELICLRISIILFVVHVMFGIALIAKYVFF